MATDKRIRVLIVDDSAFMRKVLQSIISADPQLEVVGEARDGRDAVTKAEELKPDVITMDINMPHVDGLQATELIMSSNPRPIVIVSSESRDGADITLKALELGAIDFVAKPSSGIDLDMNSVREELGRKLRMASKVRVVRTAVRSKLQTEIATSAPRTEPASQLAANAAAASNSNSAPAALNYKPAVAASAMVVPTPPSAKPSGGRYPIVVIASSTGGPATLMKFVPMFARDFPGTVLIAQHMPGTFTGQFSQQLAEISKIKVKEAEHGEMANPGIVYICPGSHHLRLTGAGRITLDDGPRISGYRPCADVAMETAAAYGGP
ncbi:MAG TPA: chemotaxis-specific protein-glutamate methyltransferase CheB, partial [Terriglobales bacterium]|nr:chemotaxis-specific protein-glutamate methyltransferase CheB [Terriglobales bacterium]